MIRNGFSAPADLLSLGDQLEWRADHSIRRKKNMHAVPVREERGTSHGRESVVPTPRSGEPQTAIELSPGVENSGSPGALNDWPHVCGRRRKDGCVRPSLPARQVVRSPISRETSRFERPHGCMDALSRWERSSVRSQRIPAC